MQLSGNTVLVTGGSNGIGLALAERFLTMGNRVVLCGRREEKLEEAQRRHPELATRVCDLARAEERASLVAWLDETFPDLNVLVKRVLHKECHCVYSGSRSSLCKTVQNVIRAKR